MSASPEGSGEACEDQAACENGRDEDRAGCRFLDQEDAAKDVEAADQSGQPLVRDGKPAMGEALHDLCDAAHDHQDAEDHHAGEGGGDGVEGGQNPENDQHSAEADEPAGFKALGVGKAKGVEAVGHGFLRLGAGFVLADLYREACRFRDTTHDIAVRIRQDDMFCKVGRRDKAG